MGFRGAAVRRRRDRQSRGDSRPTETPVAPPSRSRRWRRRWVTPSSASTRRAASTLSRIAIAGKRGPSKGAGVLLGDEENPFANISVATMKVRRRIERTAVADEEVIAVMIGSVPRRDQHGVVLGGVQRAERGIRDHRARQHDTTLEPEVLDGVKAPMRISRRLRGANRVRRRESGEGQEEGGGRAHGGRSMALERSGRSGRVR